ncbi:MAG: hypothetical protein ACOCYT_03210 [Chloroflexota bacterium]
MRTDTFKLAIMLLIALVAASYLISGLIRYSPALYYGYGNPAHADGYLLMNAPRVSPPIGYYAGYHHSVVLGGGIVLLHPTV